MGDGAQATAATLSTAGGEALDSAGDLFIADTGDNRVREVNHITGVITTVAGTGLAGYSGDGGPATAAELDRPERRGPGFRRETSSSPTRRITGFAR